VVQRTQLVVVALVVAALVVVGVYVSVARLYQQAGNQSTGVSGAGVQVVAAENFWGSLVSQLGGSKVNVTSIVSDPNKDPHTYEDSTADAIAITNAQLVIVNGAGYDTWALRIISAESTANQIVLNVQELINQPMDANPHFWYSPYFVNDTVAGMYKDLVKIDPADKAYFASQYATLNSSLYRSFMSEEKSIKHQFAGTAVASTESIFVYMANATGLNVISPPEFMKAVAEGSEPSAQDVATFEDQLNGGNTTVHMLVYNAQTVTPLTQSLLALAAQNQIPYIRITETIQPPSFTFQAWMQGEVGQLYNALNAEALGK
jgi:zinc/manganese transport system substrate-binding protein